MLSRAVAITTSRGQQLLWKSSTTVAALDQPARWLSSSSGDNGNGNNKFRPRRRPGKQYRGMPQALKKPRKPKGPKEPQDISVKTPMIDFSNIKITDSGEVEDMEALTDMGPLANTVIQMMQQGKYDKLDLETQLKMMDYFTSEAGSTEDLVGERRALALGAVDGLNREQVMFEIDRLVEEERLLNMELPPTDVLTLDDLKREESAGGSGQMPANRLAHGDWGELLIRTDAVSKSWRGGRIMSYRALVIGGNLRGCGGFGVGKAFEPEDAVDIACRMARRNIFFVDRYRNRGLTRDLVGRQNSCKVYLRATDNGLRGNPLSQEILKLMGITNVVAKAHGNRSHINVVRATFKALQTHESLEEIAMKRGLRLVNLQKAKRLQI